MVPPATVLVPFRLTVAFCNALWRIDRHWIPALVLPWTVIVPLYALEVPVTWTMLWDGPFWPELSIVTGPEPVIGPSMKISWEVY